MAQDGKHLTPAPGHLVAKELEPELEKKLTSSSTFEVAGGNEHSQLKLARVVANGGPSLEDRESAANIGKTVDFTKFLDELPQALKAGDVVAFQSLSAHKLRVLGEQYLIIPYQFINAKVEVEDGKV